jgi:hypothetical protein
MITSDRRSARTRKTTIIVASDAINAVVAAEFGLREGRPGGCFWKVIRVEGELADGDLAGGLGA